MHSRVSCAGASVASGIFLSNTTNIKSLTGYKDSDGKITEAYQYFKINEEGEREAVKRGTTTVGIKFKDGVVLIVDKRLSSKLIEPDSIEKIFKIDSHVGCATSGLVADARALVDRARTVCQVNSFNYGEKLAVGSFVK